MDKLTGILKVFKYFSFCLSVLALCGQRQQISNDQWATRKETVVHLSGCCYIKVKSATNKFELQNNFPINTDFFHSAFFCPRLDVGVDIYHCMFNPKFLI